MFCGIKSYVFKCCLLALTQPHNRFDTRLLPCRWYVVRSQLRTSTVQVCQVATVVMETTQLVPSQFLKLFSAVNG